MKAKYTAGLWKVCASDILGTVEIVGKTFNEPDPVARVYSTRAFEVFPDGNRDANATRIVACVNALEGIPDPSAFMAIVRDNASLHMENDGSACRCELCHALKGLL